MNYDPSQYPNKYRQQEIKLAELQDALDKIASLLEIAQEFSGAAQNALNIANRARNR